MALTSDSHNFYQRTIPFISFFAKSYKMENKGLKAEILNVCKQIQKQTIDRLSSTVEDSQKSANEYGCPRDRYDAFRAQLLRQRDMFAQQLQKAVEQLDTLNRISPEKKLDKVEFGAVVTTNKNKLFISIGLGKIVIPFSNHEKVEYYSVSPIVPIYKAMEGKRVGDGFVFNGQKYIIENIF